MDQNDAPPPPQYDLSFDRMIPERPTKQRKRRYATLKNQDYSDHHSSNNHHHDDDGDDSSSDDSDSDADDEQNYRHHQQKQQYRETQRDMNLYGSFLNYNDDEADDDDHQRRPPRISLSQTTKNSNHRGNHRHPDSFVPNAPPIFVSAAVTTVTTSTSTPNSTATTSFAATTTTTNTDNIPAPMEHSIKGGTDEKEEEGERSLKHIIPTVESSTKTNHDEINETVRTLQQSHRDSLPGPPMVVSETTPVVLPLPNNTNTNTNTMDQANAKFYALLHQGQSRRNNSSGRSNNNNTNHHHHYHHHHAVTNTKSTVATTASLRYHNNNSNTPLSSLPSPFHSHLPKSSSTLVAGKGPKVGIWEKHTRGIGMKLLTKMGYSGTGGLVSSATKRRQLQQQLLPIDDTTTTSTSPTTIKDDAHNPLSVPINQKNSATTTESLPPLPPREGIAAPVPVKIRPMNLGLGYGNFKEATSMKLPSTSRQQQQQLKQQHRQDNQSSSPPSVDDEFTRSTMSTMQQQLWKRYKQKNHDERSHVIPYTQLLQQQEQGSDNGTTVKSETPMTILDLRGPIPSIVSPMELSSSIDRPPSTENDVLQKPLSLSVEEVDQALLQDELLHTVTQLCHATYAYQVQHTQYQMDNIQQQQNTLQKEYNDDLKNIQLLQERQGKLQRVLNIFQQMETIVQQNSGPKKSPSTESDDPNENHLVMAQQQLHEMIQQLILPLLDAFTLEERQQLHLSSTLIPTIIGTMINNTIFDQWDPFVRLDDYEQSKTIFRSVLSLSVHNKSSGDVTNPTNTTTLYKDDMYQIRHTLIRNYILPKFQRLYESSHWDPMNDETEIGLNLFEWFLHILHHEEINRNDASTPTTNENDHSDDILFQTVPKKENTGTLLANMVTKQLIHTVVYNKILRVLNHNWKPKWDETKGCLVHRPDIWIVPWLPYIATDKSLMPTLVSDCKRAVKHAVSYLHRTIPPTQNDVYIEICLQTLRGWIGILKMDTLHNIMSAASVVSRFAHYLSHCNIPMDEQILSTVAPTNTIRTQNHWKTALQTLFQYHQLNLVSDVQFLSLLEGELLPHWANAIYQYIGNHMVLNNQRILQNNNGDSSKTTDNSKMIETLGQVYIMWKHHIFGGAHELPVADSNKVGTSNNVCAVTPSHALLRDDVQICECFYSVLRMISTCWHTLHSNASNTSERSSDVNDTVSFDAFRLSAQGYRTVYKRRNDKKKQQEIGRAHV